MFDILPAQSVYIPVWYVHNVPTPSCGIFHSKLCFVHTPNWYVPTPRCGIFPPQNVAFLTLQTRICFHPTLWYAHTSSCGMFLFGILTWQTGIFPSQTVVCSLPKLWYVNTPYCFIPTPSCGIFASKTVVCSCLVFCHPKLWQIPA